MRKTQHGGRRKGAGRPAGSGKYRDVTRVIRIPDSMVDQVLTYVQSNGCRIPLYSNKVSAGFPSPADDHIEKQLNLNEHLIKNPPSTFFVKASGESMKGAGIFSGDILVVDRSIKPVNGKIVIAVIDGELTVKRLKKDKDALFLLPENPEFDPILVKSMQDFSIWGVVTYVIHAL